MEYAIVSRLLEYIDPWDWFDWGFGPEHFKRKRKSQNKFWPEGKRNRNYHMARILYFKNKFIKKQKVKPILLDFWHEYEVAMQDGRHRLAGAVLAGVKRIAIDAGGYTRDINYVTGKSKSRPKYRW